jgi:hypothetical protein
VTTVRWQPVAVGAGLLLPPVVLAAAVWPDGGGGGGRGPGDVEAELGPGDAADGTSDGFGPVGYLVTGPGTLTIDVDAEGWDPTLTIVDPDSGRQLDYNDDREGSLNSRLVVRLDDDESVVAQVRSLNGPPGGRFTIAVSGGDEGDGDVGSEGGEAAGEPFTAPITEPIVVEGQGFSVRLYTEASGSTCLEVESANSGSGTCGSTLADLVQRGGFGGSSDGRTSTIDVVSLVGPEVAEVVAVLLDGSEVPMQLLALPGRVEQVVVGQFRVSGDVFERGGSGVGIELRDADGDVLETWVA